MVKKAIIIFGGATLVVLALVVSGVMLPVDYSGWVVGQLKGPPSKVAEDSDRRDGSSRKRFPLSAAVNNLGAAELEARDLEEVTAMIGRALGDSSDHLEWLKGAFQSERFWRQMFARADGAGAAAFSPAALVANQGGPAFGGAPGAVGSLAALNSLDDAEETGGPGPTALPIDNTPVNRALPEPGTLSLFAIGLLICGFLTYKKWRSGS